MRRKALTGLAAGISLTASAAAAGPFGIDVETATPAALGCEQLTHQGEWYRCDGLAAGMPGVKSVSMRYVEPDGVCSITANTESVQGDRKGKKLRGQVDSVADELSRLYGPATKTDMNIMKPFEPEEITDEWLEELKGHTRMYGYSMGAPDPSTGVLSVSVRASVEGSIIESGGHGAVVIAFTISESGVCDAG